MRHKHCLILAIIAASVFAESFVPVTIGQQIIEDNVATPIERRVMLETTLTLNGVDYAVTAEHVLYDGDDLTRVFHYPHYTSEPLPRRRQFAIEVSLKQTGAVDADEWTCVRLSAPRFELNTDVGFVVAPPVIGIGVQHRADGDRLLVANWSVSLNWSTCWVYAVSPDHRLAPVPKVVHIDHMSGERTPAVDDVWTRPISPPDYITRIPLPRYSYLDKDCRIFLSGDDKNIEVVRGAWGYDKTKKYPPGTRTIDVAKYMIMTYRYDLETGNVTTHAPTPQQSASFKAMTLHGPPKPITRRDLAPSIHDK